MMLRVPIAWLVALAVLAMPPVASAALPGENGKIAFSSNRSGDYAIYTVNPDGTGVSALTHRGQGVADREPAWGPLGADIAFAGTDGNYDLFVAFADGSNLKDLFPATGEISARHDPSWSPDGTRIAYKELDGIHVVNADGTNDHAVVEGLDPSWSPDGSKIAFYHSGAADDVDIWTIDLATGALTDVTNRPGLDYQPDWSPDGTKIAFEGAPAGGGATRIYTVDADGSNLAPIGPDLSSTDLRPAWAPDGTRIAFASRMDGDFDIYTMAADGTDVRQVTNDPGLDQEPTWQPLPSKVTGYGPVPRGASPLQVSLVPAFRPCVDANRTHGGPLAYPSCRPPDRGTVWITIGTPDVNGSGSNSIGSVRYRAVAGHPGPPDDADVRISSEITDVRCIATWETFCSGGGSQMPDYIGELREDVGLRLTDWDNTHPAASGSWPATVPDSRFPVTMTCAPTAVVSIGSVCSVTTSANAVVPGFVKEGKRSVWALDQVRVYDGGQDGDAETTTDNALFEVQGIAVP